MRKLNLFILLLLPILFTACGAATKTDNTIQSNSQPQQQEKFSLKNALSLGQSLKCTYEENGFTVTTLVKGNKYKVNEVVLEGSKGTGGVVSDGEYMYSWDNVTKQGAKFSLKAMQDLPKDSQSTDNPQANAFDFEEWANETEGKYKVDCKPALLTDAEFAPPTDVTFQDMTEFFKQMGDLSKNIQTDPSSAPNAVDLEKMGELFKGMGAGNGSLPEEGSAEE